MSTPQPGSAPAAASSNMVDDTAPQRAAPSQQSARPDSDSTQHTRTQDDDSTVADEEQNKKSNVPAWIVDNLRSARSWRLVARCLVASWANFVLMIPGPSLRVLGQAAFFGTMVTLMIPPSMPFFLFFLAYTVLVVGSCIGWAWGCAASAAAARARNKALLAAAIQRTQSGAASATNPEAYVVQAVFRGDYLDARSTAVFGVFLMLGVYFAAVLQIKAPKLKIGCVFMLILMDIMCMYGPLFPYARYTLGTIFMLPIGCSLAICIAAQLLIFPETLSYAWQRRYIDMLTSTRKLVKLHSEALADVAKQNDPIPHPSAQSHHMPPSGDFLKQSLKAEAEAAKIAATHLAEIKANRIILSEQMDDINGMTPFLGMEFYRSYMDSHNMKVMFRKTRYVNLQLLMLNSFWRLVHHELGLADPSTFEEDWDPSKLQQGYDADGEHGTEALPSKGHLKPIRLHESHTLHRVRQRIFKSEAEQQVTLARMLDILNQVAAPSLDAASNSIGAVQDYFEANVAWRKKRSIDEIVANLHETKSSLESARQDLLNDKRLELLKPYAEHFRAMHPDLDIQQHFLQTKESIRSFRAGVRPLHICLVFATGLIDVMDSISNLHSEMLGISERAANKKRIWWPKRLGRLVTVLSSNKRGSSDGLDGLGSKGAAFEREEDIDREFRQDRAETATDTSSVENADLAEHLDSESDSEDEDTLRSSSRSTQQRDVEKASASTKPSHKKADRKARNKAERKSRYYTRDPDALPPTNVRHRIGRGIAATYSFISGPTGMYALRMCIASFAIWIVQVLPNTANFVYKNRGIWALIMAQTAAALSGGELIFTYSMRLGGTFIGLLIGSVMWYISTGTGNGNPYGIAAVAAVGFVPLIFLRVFAPKIFLLPALILNTSVVLVIGYSWVDTHLTVTANSGVGINLAWKRTLLVVIGMSIALIVMIFPRPISSRVLLRKSMAKVTRQLNETFVEVMETWIARNRIMERELERSGFDNELEARQEHGDKDASADAVLKLWSERNALLRARFLSLSAQIASYSMQIGFASMDFHVRGRWPAERYVEIASVHATIVESLGAVIASVRAFDGISVSSEGETTIDRRTDKPADRGKLDWQLALVSSTSLLDPQFLSEICMTFDLLSKALRNGERVNHASFSLLENHFKYGMQNRRRDALLKQHGKDGQSVAREGVDILSWDVLSDPMYLRYTTARMAAITLATELDKLKAIVQDLVGESSLRGFDELKERHDDRNYRAAQAAADGD